MLAASIGYSFSKLVYSNRIGSVVTRMRTRKILDHIGVVPIPSQVLVKHINFGPFVDPSFDYIFIKSSGLDSSKL